MTLQGAAARGEVAWGMVAYHVTAGVCLPLRPGDMRHILLLLNHQA